MGRYEDLTLTVGVFFKDGTEHTNQVRFKGRLLANGEEVSFATREGAVRETEWEIYQTDDDFEDLIPSVAVISPALGVVWFNTREAAIAEASVLKEE